MYIFWRMVNNTKSLLVVLLHISFRTKNLFLHTKEIAKFCMLKMSTTLFSDIDSLYFISKSIVSSLRKTGFYSF